MRTTDEARAGETLNYARDVAAAATERAAAAERRAATLSGGLAIAVSFTISGAALIIDQVEQRTWRVVFAILLLLVAVFFVFGALHALRATIAFRKWAWPRARSVVDLKAKTIAEERVERAAEALKDFAYNWEVAWVKLRSLDTALLFLQIGLLSLLLLALLFSIYAAFW